MTENKNNKKPEKEQKLEAKIEDSKQMCEKKKKSTAERTSRGVSADISREAITTHYDPWDRNNDPDWGSSGW